ncbi:MAG: GNAT family N-acetyltransferase [Acidimicrobiales bacterium]
MTISMPAIEVSEAADVTDELVQAFARLVPQLSSSSAPPTRQALADMVASPAVTVLLARDTDSMRIVGTLSLVMFPIPTAFRAWIEDVVVDEGARGLGVGEALTNEAVKRAAAAGARTVDLTSRPSRKAANRLYRRLGFVARETNVYRLDISS